MNIRFSSLIPEEISETILCRKAMFRRSFNQEVMYLIENAVAARDLVDYENLLLGTKMGKAGVESPTQRRSLIFENDFYERLQSRARMNRRSVNQEVIFLIECGLLMEEARSQEIIRLAQLASAAPSPAHTGTAEQ